MAKKNGKLIARRIAIVLAIVVASAVGFVWLLHSNEAYEYHKRVMPFRDALAKIHEDMASEVSDRTTILDIDAAQNERDILGEWVALHTAALKRESLLALDAAFADYRLVLAMHGQDEGSSIDLTSSATGSRDLSQDKGDAMRRADQELAKADAALAVGK